MRKRTLFILMLLLTGCTPAAPVPTATAAVPEALQTAAAMPKRPDGSAASSIPAEAEAASTVVPTAMEGSTNPLTGLPAADPGLLERRPVLVKIQNVPRESRPQWGFSLADIVYEYYIEYGDTRFAALFYGTQPDEVGPIRSARHIDIELIRMYKAVFVFGGAYDKLLNLMWESDFGNRLIREGPNTAPALYRFEPDYRNYLMVDTTLLDEVIEKYEMDNSRQDLSGMRFDSQVPAGGEDAARLYVRFSGGMYHYWDYEPDSGRYTRYSEKQDDIDRKKEVYEVHSDQLTGEPVRADNVVVLFADYTQDPEEESEVYHVNLLGSGQAFLARDGELFRLHWQRETDEDVLTLVNDDGSLFAFKPGQTWFEVLDVTSKMEQQDDDIWRFTFVMQQTG